MHGGFLTEGHGVWTIALEGREVTLLKIDYAVTLLLHGETDYDGTIRLACRFRMSRPEEPPLTLNPEATTDLGPVLELFGKTVRDVIVEVPPGRLLISFTDGTTIESDSDAKYEAWQVDAPGLMVIAMPGGGEPALFKTEEN